MTTVADPTRVTKLEITQEDIDKARRLIDEGQDGLRHCGAAQALRRVFNTETVYLGFRFGSMTVRGKPYDVELDDEGDRWVHRFMDYWRDTPANGGVEPTTLAVAIKQPGPAVPFTFYVMDLQRTGGQGR